MLTEYVYHLWSATKALWFDSLITEAEKAIDDANKTKQEKQKPDRQAKMTDLWASLNNHLKYRYDQSDSLP